MTAELGTVPVRKTLFVELGVEEAFALFWDRIGVWWPTRTHSIHGDETAEVVVEGRAGGRIFERSRGGQEAHWADILAWDRPERVVLDWRVNPAAAAPTEVEVRFADDGGRTRVELVHRGWERFGPTAEETRASYDSGWDLVLGHYVGSAGPSR
jgi:uncharacterized protein YndB with AHSA1/START domain